jgi:hypothetical protein
MARRATEACRQHVEGRSAPERNRAKRSAPQCAKLHDSVEDDERHEVPRRQRSERGCIGRGWAPISGELY